MVLCRGARLGFLFQRSSVQTRLLSPWYLPESLPFPRCTPAESCMGGCLGMLSDKTLLGLSPVRQAQCRSRHSQMYHLLVSVWGVSLSPGASDRGGWRGWPRAAGLCAAEQSQGCRAAPGRHQPTLLQAGSPSAEQWLRSHPAGTGVPDGLWRGDIPAWLAATCMTTACIRRAASEVSAVCLLKSTLQFLSSDHPMHHCIFPGLDFLFPPLTLLLLPSLTLDSLL